MSLQIDTYHRKELVDEIRYCSNKMAEEKDLQRKMYFYGKTFYAVSRIMELGYDRHLNFIELVLEISQKSISARINKITKEEEKTVPLLEGFFERIVENLNKLATKIEKDEDTYETLEEIVKLTYLTTEDGYYQYLRGQIKL